LIVANLFSFLAVGVYRGIWRYTSINDFVTFFKGITLGSILSVLGLLLLYRFQNFSRTLFVVDAILLFIALAGSRMAFRLFRQLLPSPMSNEGRKVLIYGAGDGGEMILRELENNPEWNYKPVGFVDDNPLKKDRVIHGLRVFGGNGSLQQICLDNEVEEILLSFRNASPDKLKEIRKLCTEVDVTVKRALLKIEPID
jgi:UDP-GlcNAc:undecaprenyl-phosphate GlcNAc-1-phosphate transferase